MRSKRLYDGRNLPIAHQTGNTVSEKRPIFKPLKRVSAHEVKTFAELYTFLGERELLAGTGHAYYAQAWNIAHAGSFTVLPEVKATAEAQGQAA